MFYTTTISVTLWIINNNKRERTDKLNDVVKNYRERKEEVLFIDLREVGIPFEKKFIQFSEENVNYISSTYHEWQLKDSDYKDVPEYCFSANIEEIKKKDYSLVPSKYIEFINRDENINFDEKMTSLKSEFTELLREEEQSKKDLLNVFKELGYEIEL